MVLNIDACDHVCLIFLQVLTKLFGESLPERLIETGAFIYSIVRILINDSVNPLIGVIHGSESSRIHMVILIVASPIYEIRPLVVQVPDCKGVGICIVIDLRVQILIVPCVFRPQPPSIVIINSYLNDVSSVPGNIIPSDP